MLCYIDSGACKRALNLHQNKRLSPTETLFLQKLTDIVNMCKYKPMLTSKKETFDKEEMPFYCKLCIK